MMTPARRRKGAIWSCIRAAPPRSFCCAARARRSRCWPAAARCMSGSCRGSMSSRAALRETWEEAGVLIGRPARWFSAPPVRAPIEQAYRDRNLAAGLDLLTYVGRAITPSHSPRRFNTRFFLGDGGNVFGEPSASEELEDLRWHPIGQRLLASFADVTRFMLARALALRTGTASGAAPLFYWAKNARRIGVCRESSTSPADGERG